MKFKVCWSTPAYDHHSSGPGQPIDELVEGSAIIDADSEEDAKYKAEKIGRDRNIHSVKQID